MNAVVVANFRVTELSMIPGFQHTGTWYDYFTGNAIDVTNVSAFMDFAPGEYHVYVDQLVDFPSDLSEQLTVVTSQDYSTLYPNPNQGHCIWEVDRPLMKPQVLVWDGLGRKVESSYDVDILSNGQAIALNFDGLTSGVYTLQLIDNENAWHQVIHVLP